MYTCAPTYSKRVGRNSSQPQEAGLRLYVKGRTGFQHQHLEYSSDENHPGKFWNTKSCLKKVRPLLQLNVCSNR